MRLPIQIRIEVESDLQAIDLVLLQFNKLYDNRISQQDWLQCQLALVEGFTNAVRHAHRNLPLETPIEIEFALCLEKITIRIFDYGQPFDLNNFINTMLAKDTNWLGSGRGIAIINKVSDVLKYDRISNNKNCLVITKYFNR